MKLTSWGAYPKIEATEHYPRTADAVHTNLLRCSRLIPRGLGRSYGDSALAQDVLNTRLLDHFVTFDAEHGIITCQAGVSFASLLEIVVPQGWFLPVTPGTKYVSVGGAIASDVHGKNHHLHGCFSEYVVAMQLMLADGSRVICSRNEHSELFRATCGGMGLTGVILQATLTLKKITSAYIQSTVLTAQNLAHIFELFAQYPATTYSVAWIDCLATGKALGRSVLMLGEHASLGELAVHHNKKITIPCHLPSLFLNRFSIALFNAAYFHRQSWSQGLSTVHYDPFFYPLDKIAHWNRLYGRHGFTQYQLVLPKAAGLAGMTDIMRKITTSGRGSFLSVLKVCGPHNQNYLSFPIEGYSLALDFKITSGVWALLAALDAIVLAYGGRVYLTKDVRMSEETFKTSYTHWQEFARVRQEYGGNKKFYSLQSIRLGL